MLYSTRYTVRGARREVWDEVASEHVGYGAVCAASPASGAGGSMKITRMAAVCCADNAGWSVQHAPEHSGRAHDAYDAWVREVGPQRTALFQCRLTGANTFRGVTWSLHPLRVPRPAWNSILPFAAEVAVVKELSQWTLAQLAGGDIPSRTELDGDGRGPDAGP